MSQPTPYSPGPFLRPHIYIQWGGLLPGQEQWTCGIRYGATGVDESPSAAVDQAASMLAAAATAISAFHSRAASGISDPALLTFVKTNAISTAGLYLEQATNEQAMPNVFGGNNSAGHPNQVCLVASLTTEFSRGPASKGRFYIPLPSSSPQATTGLIEESAALAVAGSVKTLITALDGISPDWTPMVMSRKAGAPAQRQITGVRVGRVLDTQRRRRKSLAELYKVAA